MCETSYEVKISVARWRRRFVHVPLSVMTSRRNQVDPDGDLWMSVLETTCQPAAFGLAPEREKIHTGYCLEG